MRSHPLPLAEVSAKIIIVPLLAEAEAGLVIPIIGAALAFVSH